MAAFLAIVGVFFLPVGSGERFANAAFYDSDDAAAIDAAEESSGSNPNHATSSPKDDASLAAGLTVKAMAAGAIHTCAVLSDGGVKCWGWNLEGKLGNGTTAFSEPSPVAVVDLDTTIVEIASGNEHTCALTDAGGVKCWGSNPVGALGNGTTTNSLSPVDVVGLGSNVRAVRTSTGHSCAITTADAALCWGSNGSGALGDGTTETRLEPVSVEGLGSGVADVSMGNGHTCAVKTSGALVCWGLNLDGQLGTGEVGTPSNSNVPVDVVDMSTGVLGVAAGGRHTCAVLTSGSVKCWGDNTYGELGDGTTQDRLTPVTVQGLTDAVAVTAGWQHTCALTAGGEVKCWGFNGDVGALGDGGTCGRICTTPTFVTGLSSVGAISAGSAGSHTCALMSDRELQCWGWNGNGQLGDGTTTTRPIPVDVIGLATKQTPEPTAMPTRTPQAVRLGDANGDGRVNSIDAALILQRAAGLLGSVNDESAADTNRDGRINAVDAALILQHVAGLINLGGPTNTPTRTRTPTRTPTQIPTMTSTPSGVVYPCETDASCNCPDFPTHAEAQRVFLLHGGSPGNNWAGLDNDHDGSACDDLP